MVKKGSYLQDIHPSLPVQDLLINAGFEVELEQNLDGILWGKLILNAAINPLTAILEIRNGDRLKYPNSTISYRTDHRRSGPNYR